MLNNKGRLPAVLWLLLCLPKAILLAARWLLWAKRKYKGKRKGKVQQKKRGVALFVRSLGSFVHNVRIKIKIKRVTMSNRIWYHMDVKIILI